MKLHPTLLALAAAAALMGQAQAQTFTGATSAASPTYNRAFFDFSGLSNNGIGAHYQVAQFTVTASGSYTFQNTAAGNWDNFTFIYQGAFNPASPLVNGVIGNDDNPTIGLSGFTTALSTGINYFYVTTGFSATDFGAYSVTATGPGSVVLTTAAVPEPETYALMALGLGGVALFARRRRNAA